MSGAELSSYIPKQTDNCVYDLLLPLDIKRLGSYAILHMSVFEIYKTLDFCRDEPGVAFSLFEQSSCKEFQTLNPA